ncbi:MAG: hypothetical protein L3J05_00905 [Robiginitomaculum sp.]|nr:hypothetical protein [Robiginitomaculum sp.]
MKHILVLAAAVLVFGAFSDKINSAPHAETDDREQFDTALLQKDGAEAEPDPTKWTEITLPTEEQIAGSFYIMNTYQHGAHSCGELYWLQNFLAQ